MQPNIALSPAPRLMHDIMPPYAKALPKAELQPEAQQPVASSQAEVPVYQPTQPQDSSPSPMFPVIEEAQTMPMPETEHSPQSQPAVITTYDDQILTHTSRSQNKINWSIIGLAVLVSAVLLAAALFVLSQNQ